MKLTSAGTMMNEGKIGWDNNKNMNPVNGNSRSNISIALSITFVMNEVIKTAMLNYNKSISSVQTRIINFEKVNGNLSVIWTIFVSNKKR